MKVISGDIEVSDDEIEEVQKVFWHKESNIICLEFKDGLRCYPRRITIGFYDRLIYLSNDEYREFLKEDDELIKKKWWQIWK